MLYGGPACTRPRSCLWQLADTKSELFLSILRSSWTNKLITAKDHGAVQINIGHLNEEGVYITGQFSTFALVGNVRAVVSFRYPSPAVGA